MKIDKFNCRVMVASFIVLSFTGCSSGGGNNSEATPQLCGTTIYPSNTGISPPAPILESSQVWSFVSAPNLHPMKVSVSPYDPKLLASGYIFNGPFAFSSFSTIGQSGALIADNDGNPIWFNPLSSPSLVNMDFRVQKLYGSPVLVYLQGTLANPPAYTNVPAGSAEPGSCFYIMNGARQSKHTLRCANILS